MKKRFLLVVMLVLGAFALPATAQGIDEATLAEIIAFYIAEDAPGVVLFVNDNGETSAAAFGAADIETGAAVAADDLFRIGSTTKPMVAAAAVSLAEDGLLDLDAPLADFLPDEITTRVANVDTATVREALAMRSGIYNYTENDAFTDAVLDNPDRPWTAAETVAYAYDEEPEFAPGEGYYYSNTNYNLVEIVINETSGQSLADVLAERIFTPAGMDNCFLETPDRFADGIVRGYLLDDDDSFLDVTEENDAAGLADGGVVCTAADLAKFPVALFNGDILSEDALAEMIDALDDGEGSAYGLGIGYDDDPDYGLLAAHSGATGGFQSMMVYLPDEGLTVTLVTNNFDADYVESMVFDAIDAAFRG